MASVLLVYRVNDGDGYATRLKPRLISGFGASRVVDAPTVPNPGDVVVALIGRTWLRAPRPEGGRALDDPNDPVRRVLEEAIKLGLKIITVFLDKTPRPPADQLPGELLSILKCPRFELSFANFHQDVDALIAALKI